MEVVNDHARKFYGVGSHLIGNAPYNIGNGQEGEEVCRC